MSTPLTQRLYLRIWLAVVAAVVVLTLLFGWFWHLDAERERTQRPGREIVLRDTGGEIIGQAVAKPILVPGEGLEFIVPTRDGQTIHVLLPRPANRPQPVPVPSWWHQPYSLLWMFGLFAAAVALGAYPVIRRLTKRLEGLQIGVERWGQGDLSHRLPEEGRDEVAFLAQRFNIAAERVQALLVSHKTLLANASHELRSPLTRIRMGLELLPAPALGTDVSSLDVPLRDATALPPVPACAGRPGAAGVSPEGALAPRDGPAALKSSLNWKDEISRNIHELDQLIDEILLASRLDASPIDIGTLEPVDLVGLCAEECAQAGADLDVPSGQTTLMVQGVARLLHRVVRNLLENARRHAASDVQLSLQLAQTQAVIRVCDRGPGVPADLRERIFEPFYRLPGASEREGGVGLGLALVKSIAQRHGGSVHCEDRPGGGACFVVALPRLR
jgi:two-component system, OmpR family, sensor kinase